jgi:acetyl esterase/lipase
VVLHGGFWRWPYGRWLTWSVARSLATSGWSSLNVGYRRVGRLGGGGGWPATFRDVVAAVDAGRSAMSVPSPVDGAPVSPRTVVLGHSAGGHLALWLASHPDLDLQGVISLGGLTDMRAGLDHERWSGPVRSLLHRELDDRLLACTSPAERLPLRTRVALIHGEHDTIVPIDSVRRFASDARNLGGSVELHVVDGDDHRDALMARSHTWVIVRQVLSGWFDEAAES